MKIINIEKKMKYGNVNMEMKISNILLAAKGLILLSTCLVIILAI